MTFEEALEECPDIDAFCHTMCVSCTSNDWYCPTYCELLMKAHRMPFEKIIKSYCRNDGDPVRLARYIRRYKEKDNGRTGI